jgi:tripartite-type tricarboxylate transporter receptor subunit TctC
LGRLRYFDQNLFEAIFPRDVLPLLPGAVQSTHNCTCRILAERTNEGKSNDFSPEGEAAPVTPQHASLMRLTCYVFLVRPGGADQVVPVANAMVHCGGVSVKKSGLGGLVVALGLALSVAISLVPSAHAQTYPDRPIKLLVPLAAASAVDIVARIVGEKMSQNLGQRIYVEDMPGAAGLLGMRAGARAAPDGYTVVVPNDSVLTMLPNMKSDVGYDPLRDFVPVTQLAGIPLGLIANPEFPAKTIPEFIAMARKNPGGINYASGGPGSPQHIAMELFARAAGIELTHVPHRGITAAVNEIVAGHVPLGFTALSAVFPLVPDNRVRLLATSTRARVPQFPDVPTIAETLPGFSFGAWCAFLVPAKTPPEIVAKLHDAAVAALQDSSVRTRLVELGFEPVGDTPEQLATFMRQEFQRTGDLIRAANIHE